VAGVPDVAAAPGMAVGRLDRVPVSPRAAASAVHSTGVAAGVPDPPPAPDGEVGEGTVATIGVAVMTGSLGTSCTGMSSTGTAAEARTEARADAAAAGTDGTESGRDTELEPRADRVAETRNRDGPLVADWAERAGPASVEDPVEPSDPAMSAKAAGIEAMPAPTPRAKASAPTRPT